MGTSYSNYMLEDLIANQSFRKWVKDPDSDQEDFWQEWLYQYPEKAPLAAQARQIILDLSDDDLDNPFEEEIDDVWARIVDTNARAAVSSEETLKTTDDSDSFGNNSFFSAGLQWVAILAGIILSTGIGLYFLVDEDTVQYATRYGELKTVNLPDGTVVQLNANSSIRCQKEWNTTQTREVWLKGEAYFSVAHTPQHQKFRVHTPEVTIEVLGTEFNVSTRRQKAQVLLTEGKVQLQPILTMPQAVEMHPGDFVEVNPINDTLIRRRINPDTYTAWKQNKLVFEEAVLSEIALVLEDNYGYQMQFADKELEKLTFTGSVTRDKIPLLFTILEKTFQLQINRNGNKLTVSRLR